MIRSHSIVVPSTIAIFALINIGLVYSEFPSDWLKVVDLLDMVDLLKIGFNSVPLWLMVVSFITLPSAVIMTVRKKGGFENIAKYGLFLIPLLPTFAMVIWAAYCGIQNTETLYPQGNIAGYPFLESLFIKGPWYSCVVRDFFLSSAIYLSGIALYTSLSKSWQDERWIAFTIFLNEAIWIHYFYSLSIFLSSLS